MPHVDTPHVLILGSGGREHALALALARSPQRPRLTCAPGNPGTAIVAANIPVNPTDAAAVLAAARELHVDLVVCGPEAPLAAGVADVLRRAGIAVVGPSAAAAQLESSKAFAKDVMDAAGVPTADWAVFDDPAEAHQCIEDMGAPIVVKADGLAAGKGVVVAPDVATAHRAVTAALEEGAFGAAGSRVVVEECLAGDELSVIALVDADDNFVLLPSSRDHKRLRDGDRGPNTGGMGAVSPAPGVTDEVLTTVAETVVAPTLAELRRRGTPFTGFLYAGIMLTAAGPQVIEFNVRLGDPEAQVILTRLRGDVLELLQRAASGSLAGAVAPATPGAAATVVIAAPGYPQRPSLGAAIDGVGAAMGTLGVTVHHAGTRRGADGTLRVAGGRVLAVTAVSAQLETALGHAYAAVDAISLPGRQVRRDIGQRHVVDSPSTGRVATAVGWSSRNSVGAAVAPTSTPALPCS